MRMAIAVSADDRMIGKAVGSTGDEVFPAATTAFSPFTRAAVVRLKTAADTVTTTARSEPTGPGDMDQLKRGARISTAEPSGDRKDGTSKYVSITKKRVAHNLRARCWSGQDSHGRTQSRLSLGKWRLDLGGRLRA